MLRISQLTLTNFRNYPFLELKTDALFNVVVGHNGAGKTNILEAISFLTAGRGLRNAVLSEIDSFRHPVNYPSNCAGSVEIDSVQTVSTVSQNDIGPWVVAASIHKTDEHLTIGTGRDPMAAGEKRLVKINGKKAVSQTKLGEYLSIVWLTPAMDGLFRDSDGTRRRFLDRLAYSRFPRHAYHTSAYEKQMRERNRLLKDGAHEPSWYNALEQSMAEHAAPILKARHETLDALNHFIAEEVGDFPKGNLMLEGLADDAFRMAPEDIQSSYADMLSQARAQDRRAGRTLKGLHTSRLHVIYSNKKMPAAQCSTGEQKALLISILLAHARAQRETMESAPILLLDEVVAHLDESRRRSLFEVLEQLNTQVWMTGTDAADFSSAPSRSTWFEVKDGAVCTSMFAALETS